MASNSFLNAPIPWITKVVDLPSTPPRGYLGQLLLMVIIAETVLLGSGRMLTLGPLTIKMFLYVISLGYVGFRLLAGDSFRNSTWITLLAFTGLSMMDTVIGTFVRNDSAVVMNDLRWVAYLPALLFFDRTIRSLQTVESVSRIIRIGALLMCLGLALVFLLIATGHLTFFTIVEFCSRIYGDDPGDFIFGEKGLTRIFYKGFLYLGIGIFFWIMRPGWRSKIAALLLFCGLAASGTRGLVLAALSSLVLLVLMVDRNKVRALFVTGVVLVATVLLASMYTRVFRDKEVSSSDEMRMVTVREVQERTTPLSMITGHGLGAGVPGRPLHMEIAYLEIFYKQGLLGLVVWGGMLAYIAQRYFRLRNSRFRLLATPYFISVVFVAVQSATNAYINNPIGLAMVFVSLSVMETLHAKLPEDSLPSAAGAAR